MANKNVAVFGIYKTAQLAETAVDHIISKGFSNSAISVLMPDEDSTRAFAHEKNTKAPEGTTTGATTGGAVGGTLGLLAGIGALAIPGVGPLIAAGPIMATLAGVGVGGAVGGVVGALVGLGIPEYLNPSATTYLVWIRPSGGDAVKQGAIGIDKNLKGEMHTVTVAKNFEIFITSEQSDSVTVPSAVEVLQTHVSMD